MIRDIYIYIYPRNILLSECFTVQPPGSCTRALNCAGVIPSRTTFTEPVGSGRNARNGAAPICSKHRKRYEKSIKKHETHGEHPRKIRTSATFIVVSSFFPCFSISVIMNWRVSRSKHYHAIWSFGYGPEPAWTNQPCWLITTEEGNTTGWPFWPKLTSSPSWFEFKDLLFWWNYCMLNHIAICVTSRNSTLFGKCLAEDHHFSRIFPFFLVYRLYIPVLSQLPPAWRQSSGNSVCDPWSRRSGSISHSIHGSWAGGPSRKMTH